MSSKNLAADVPPEIEPVFRLAQDHIAAYFENSNHDPMKGTRYLGTDRHLLLRGDALGLEVVRALENVLGKSELTLDTAFELLFDISHSIGAADARTVNKKLALTDHMQRLAIGPIYFAHSGLGRVEILPDSYPVPGDDFVIRFRHHNAIEVDSWLSSGIAPDRPGCIFASGYSSGWCTGCFGIDLITVEVTCVAAGDEHCEFIMAPSHRIEDHVRPYREKHNLYVPQASGGFEIAKKLHMLAYRDGLTNLYNRTYLNEQLSKEIAKAKANNQKLALLHIDLDHFKHINDSYGHTAGDFLLVEQAKRMQKITGEDDLLARIGGDEFIIVMPNIGDEQTKLREKIRSLRNLLTEKLDYEGITLRSAASIGVAVYPDHGQDASDLMINADLTLNHMKKDGRGSYRFFNQDIRDTHNLRKNLEERLSAAIDCGDIMPFYQPQVDVLNNRITGLECLARWRSADGQYISPAEFLPAAESSGQMVRLGRSIMERAIQQVAGWQQEGLQFGRLALNASSGELREDDFADWILETILKYELPAEFLTIEVVETVIVGDEDLQLPCKLGKLRDAGVHIELDDFGTGYASLMQVRPNEIDRLKIDRSFIQGINSSGRNAMIVRSIVDLTQSLDMHVIAEGVETEAEQDVLVQIGCSELQGFGIARPMPSVETAEWIRFFAGKHQKQAEQTTSPCQKAIA